MRDLVRRERRVLLTLDKGIADVRADPPQAHAGIVLFRPPATGRGTTLLFVRRHLASESPSPSPWFTFRGQCPPPLSG